MRPRLTSNRALGLALGLGAALLGGCGSDLVIDRCRDTVCALGQRCDADTGQCVAEDPCQGVLCADGASCDPVDGLCKGAAPEKCQGVTCSATQSCDAGTGACVENPAPPTLSPTLVDRAGRPGVGNLLLNPFGLFKVNNVAETADASKDKYNADSMPARWVTAFAPYVRFNLGVFDALDGICGNQLLAGAAGAGRYTALSNLLAADALQVNTAAPACTAYLAVEVGANDCGGFRPGYDVIDSTYTFLSTGTIITPVGDGVAASAPVTDFFPFLPALP